MEKQKYVCQLCGTPLTVFRAFEHTECYIADPATGELKEQEADDDLMEIGVFCENMECENYHLFITQDVVVSDDNYIFFRDELDKKGRHPAKLWESFYGNYHQVQANSQEK